MEEDIFSKTIFARSVMIFVEALEQSTCLTGMARLMREEECGERRGNFIIGAIFRNANCPKILYLFHILFFEEAHGRRQLYRYFF